MAQPTELNNSNNHNDNNISIDLTQADSKKQQHNNKGTLIKDTTIHTSHPTLFDHVRNSTSYIIQHSKHVHIDYNQIDIELSVNESRYTPSNLPPSWAQDYHYVHQDGNHTLTCQYIIVLDALNFCFWPTEGYEYQHLASSLKNVLTNDKHAFDADNLINLTTGTLQQWLQPIQPLIDMPKHQHNDNELIQSAIQTTDYKLHSVPLLEQRVHALHEVGHVLKKYFDGLCISMIKSCNNNASQLAYTMSTYFTMWRDISMYNGNFIHYYKRIQIFIGDIYGAFNGKDIGYFKDLHNLTCFADYRIPQLLHHLNILQYSQELNNIINNYNIIQNNSIYEIEIRAATVQAVDYIQQQLSKQHNINMLSLQIDWILWYVKQNNRVNLMYRYNI